MTQVSDHGHHCPLVQFFSQTRKSEICSRLEDDRKVCQLELKCDITLFQNFSKLIEFADNNVKFDENGRKFFKQLENKVGKGDIARDEQFLLFPQCFQKSYNADV